MEADIPRTNNIANADVASLAKDVGATQAPVTSVQVPSSLAPTPPAGDVPKPVVLLGIQVGGGLLAVLPIISLNRFATLPSWLYVWLTASALANVAISAILLIGFIFQFSYLQRAVKRIGEIGVCRILIFYDILMLGSLVCLTGGSEKSAFVPQFAAILPMAVLIRDLPSFKWAYATIFLFMFLLGLTMSEGYVVYSTDLDKLVIKEIWSVVFFFIFTLFPVIYSIQSEQS